VLSRSVSELEEIKEEINAEQLQIEETRMWLVGVAAEADRRLQKRGNALVLLKSRIAVQINAERRNIDMMEAVGSSAGPHAGNMRSSQPDALARDAALLEEIDEMDDLDHPE
jgi:hypothetical protein